jgi:alpha-L-fucosidase
MDKRKFNSARDRFRLPGGRWWGGSTHKGNAIYLHILSWPADAVALPPIPRRVVRHRVLTGGEATVTQTDDGLEVRVPAADRDPIDTIVKLELDGPAGEIPVRLPGITPSGSLAAGRKASASNHFRNQHEFAPARAFDDDPETRWGCDWGTTSAWLEVDLGEAKTFARAWISEPYDRVRAFALEVWRDGRWEAIHRGERIGEDRTIRFEPATARRVRLNLLKTTEGPSIWEFHLFAR